MSKLVEIPYIKQSFNTHLSAELVSQVAFKEALFRRLKIWWQDNQNKLMPSGYINREPCYNMHCMGHLIRLPQSFISWIINHDVMNDRNKLKQLEKTIMDGKILM